jgi:hypothetical protein
MLSICICTVNLHYRDGAPIVLDVKESHDNLEKMMLIIENMVLKAPGSK